MVYNAKERYWAGGRRGQGPDEYLDIADFDVTSDGSVYFIDGRLDKLFCFNDQLEFCKAYSLPFEADIISVLDEGFLFGLSSWNKGFGENNKIMRTDMELNVLNTCLEYDENTDPSFWISSYSFVCTPDFISYNQPIDNCIYLFDYKGNIQECIDFDFASENVPNEVKKNVEKYWDSFGDYCMLKNYTVVTKRVIAGSFLKTEKQFLSYLTVWRMCVIVGMPERITIIQEQQGIVVLNGLLILSQMVILGKKFLIL